MTTREKFLASMNFDLSVPPPFYEMGYWVATIRRWYEEGLPKVQGVPEDLPAGEDVAGPLLGGDRRCTDPDRVVKFDKGMEQFPLNSWIFPKFERCILEKLDDRLIVIDEMGIKKKIASQEDSIPEYYEWPVKTRENWEKFKYERLNPKAPGRYPENLGELIKTLENRDFPLYIGAYPGSGFFGSVRFLLGEINLLTGYYDHPQLIRDIINYLVDFWIELYSPIVSRVKFDWAYIWEDMCYKTASLISPEIFREFMLPAYKKFTSFLKDNGVDIIIVDTDGNCWELIPLFIEGGVTGLFPMEVAAGMDVVEIRKKFPKLQIMGGIDKRVLSSGEKEIQEEVKRKLPYMLSKGGYICCVDHHIPPDVPLKNFIYYRNKVEKIVEEYCSQYN